MLVVTLHFVKSFITDVTCKPEFTSVYRLMVTTHLFAYKRFSTIFTVKFQTIMCSHVDFIVTVNFRSSSTYLTIITKLPCVYLHTPCQISFGSKCLITLLTLELSLSISVLYLHTIFQVWLIVYLF